MICSLHTVRWHVSTSPLRREWNLLVRIKVEIQARKAQKTPSQMRRDTKLPLKLVSDLTNVKMCTHDFLHLITVHQSSQTIVPPPTCVYWPAWRFAIVIPVYPCVLPSQLELRCAIFSSLESELTSGKMRGGF